MLRDGEELLADILKAMPLDKDARLQLVDDDHRRHQR